VGISRDYPLKTQTSKQPIGEVPGYEIIPSHPLKYPRSKQGLIVESNLLAAVSARARLATKQGLFSGIYLLCWLSS
jgi:hypothetical protein